MATEILLPQFGMGMQGAKILRWLKQVAMPSKRARPLLEIEAEKVEVEASAAPSGRSSYRCYASRTVR